MCVNGVESAERDFCVIALKDELASIVCETLRQFPILKDSRTGARKCLWSIGYEEMLTIMHS